MTVPGLIPGWVEDEEVWVLQWTVRRFVVDHLEIWHY